MSTPPDATTMPLGELSPLPRNRQMGIGCIGAGFIMADCHLVAYRAAGFNPVAIASRRPQHAREVAARHNIPRTYDHYRELLADPRVEVVDVAVPPDVQLEVISEVVRHADHIRGVLAQKPLGTSYAEALKIVMDAQPEILNHNVETVPRLFRKVQPQDHYEWAMATLTNAKQMDPLVLTKSGIMVGLGETFDEVVEVMRDLAKCGVDILTVGQYLSPSKQHLPVERYYTPEEFDRIKEIGLNELGFKWVESGPLVRSSYRADQQVRELSKLNYITLR